MMLQIQKRIPPMRIVTSRKATGKSRNQSNFRKLKRKRKRVMKVREGMMTRAMTRIQLRVTGSRKRILFQKKENPDLEDSVKDLLSSKSLKAKKTIWTAFLLSLSKLRPQSLES